MVKVLNSVPHRSVVKQVICKKCGSELEYVPIDVTTRYVKDYGGGGDNVSTIVCPTCETTLYVPEPR